MKKTCVVCGKEFHNYVKHAKTCSYECRKKMNRNRIERISYRAWQTLVEYALEVNNYRCGKCGGGNELQCHHIIPKNIGGSDKPDNLTILCSLCHAQEHRELLYKEFDRALLEPKNADIVEGFFRIVNNEIERRIKNIDSDCEHLRRKARFGE